MDLVSRFIPGEAAELVSIVSQGVCGKCCKNLRGKRLLVGFRVVVGGFIVIFEVLDIVFIVRAVRFLRVLFPEISEFP